MADKPRTVAPTAVMLYVAHMVLVSSIIFVFGFITTALGALVMVFALVGFAIHAVLAQPSSDERDDLAPRSGHAELFRWRELRTTMLAALPAWFIPSELTSPMASAVFFLLFAVPTYCVAFSYHAWSRWKSGRGETAPSHFGSPPPGWYLDPADARFVRWWDGWVWTPHALPRPL